MSQDHSPLSAVAVFRFPSTAWPKSWPSLSGLKDNRKVFNQRCTARFFWLWLIDPNKRRRKWVNLNSLTRGWSCHVVDSVWPIWGQIAKLLVLITVSFRWSQDVWHLRQCLDDLGTLGKTQTRKLERKWELISVFYASHKVTGQETCAVLSLERNLWKKSIQKESSHTRHLFWWRVGILAIKNEHTRMVHCTDALENVGKINGECLEHSLLTYFRSGVTLRPRFAQNSLTSFFLLLLIYSERNFLAFFLRSWTHACQDASSCCRVRDARLTASLSGGGTRKTRAGTIPSWPLCVFTWKSRFSELKWALHLYIYICMVLQRNRRLNKRWKSRKKSEATDKQNSVSILAILFPFWTFWIHQWTSSS